MKIYLAGPIKDCTKEEAWRWRERFQQLRPDFDWLIPPDLSDRFELGLLIDEDKVELVRDDRDMISKSDCIIANIWKDSVGTSMEIMLAHENCVPVILLIEERDEASLSPWYTEHADAIVATKIQAIDRALADWHPSLSPRIPRLISG